MKVEIYFTYYFMSPETTIGKGTKAYMAPELSIEGKFSLATDIYAYGVLMWEITTQEVPKSLEYARDAYVWGQTIDTITHTFPEYVEKLLPHCWKVDRHGRPTITQIIEQLPQGKKAYSNMN